MARRLILDTGVLIEAERGRELAAFLAADDDVAIAAVTLTELKVGVALASAQRREPRRRFVQRVLDLIPVEEYGVPTTDAHADLLAHVRRSGRTRGAHDLQIAATARATSRTVVTTDGRARYADLPGVDAVVL